jgi:glycosyltransferase involved in cell wall biosynthesis
MDGSTLPNPAWIRKPPCDLPQPVRGREHILSRGFKIWNPCLTLVPYVSSSNLEAVGAGRRLTSWSVVKVAHVSDFYLPRLGGIEMHVSDLTELQRAQGHDVQVITSTPGPDHPDLHRVTKGFRQPHALHPLAVRAGIETLRDLDVDVVHAHLGVASPLAFFLARAAARDGVPTVVTVHSMWAGVRPIMSTMDTLGGWSTLPITWTAVSEAAGAPVRRLLPPDTEIRVLANGIDQDGWRMPAAAERPEELVLVAVMRLARRKRPIALLRIVHRAQVALERLGDPTRLRLLVAGDGPHRQAMQSFLRRHEMTDSVALLGRLDRQEVRRVLGSSHVFLAPADLESFGIAALEARCAGLPVVAKAQGGVGEFIGHGREGLLCASDADMTDAVVRLVRDRELRRQIAAHNRTADCSVAWTTLLQKTEEAYASARMVQTARAQTESRRVRERQLS